MTSTNDGKDVKSNQTSGPKGKKYHIELYKSLEARLSSEDTLEARTGHVCDAWRRVYSLHQHSAPSTHPHLLSWLQRHTALTILQSEWQSSPNKDELHNRLSAAIDALVGEVAGGAQPWQQQLLARARWFRAALSNPWGHPVLKSLLNDPGEPLSDEQEWLKEERGVVFVSRLRQLAASRRTNDLALALAGAVMGRARAARAPPADDRADDAVDTTEDRTSFYALLRRDAGFLEVWDLLTDIEFVLLHKREKRARCIELAKLTPLRDGYHLVERLRSRLETSPRDKKLWKNAKEVATLIAQVVIARCMVLTTCSGAGRTALYCCARSLARLVSPERLPAVTAALAAPAATARHLHTLCSAIHAQCAGDMKPFVCELYVRAITAGMNELERLKLNPEKQAEARSAEQTLASWFTQLGTLLSASARLRAECALTAFSVHPAPEMYERVRQARPPVTVAETTPDQAAESTSDFGSWANDSRTQSNLVKTSETLRLKPSARQANVLSTAILTEGEALGLEPELGQDLAVLLAGPRVKTLAWDMDRELLLEHCRAYMDRTHGGTRALTTELKYLNLDPRAFQHLPEEDDDENDVYYGIEKGYEHLVQLEEPEGIWQNAFFDPEQTESANESELESYQNAKKKITALPSSEDEDPLSLIADAKKEQKKQARKEKRAESKERKKTVKRDTSKDGSRGRRKDKEKKPKKERKKKSDTTAPAADLVGAKIASVPAKIKSGEKRVRKKKERRREDFFTNLSVTDSDYDSQAKASQVSDNYDPSVLFDGHYSVDEMKSPERRKSSEKPKDSPSSVINSSSPTVINKIINTPSPAIKKAVSEPVSHVTKVKSTASSDSDVTRARSPFLAPSQLINRHIVNDKVKKSITKLLQFRRQKNASIPKNPVTSAHRTENIGQTNTTQQPSTKTHNEAPKVYLDKKQTEQLEAMNNLINVADVKNSEMRKIPYNEPARDFDTKLMSPQHIYNIQKQQEAMQYMSQNIVQNPNVFSDNRSAYSDCMQSSPHKHSPYSDYLSNQPMRPSSVIDTSYLSPSKQADRVCGLNLTPPKPANRISHQMFHKSMQNLTQDSVKSSPPKQLNEPRYYNQYTNNKLHDSIPRLPVNASPKSTNHLQNPSSSNSIQQQYAAMKAIRDDLVKSYQTVTDNRINPSRVPSHSTKDYSTPKLSNSMQNINDTVGAVSDSSRTFNVPRGHASHTNTQMNAHSDVLNARDMLGTYAKPNSQHVKQYPKQAKPTTNAPAKPQHIQKTQHVQKTQLSEAESQSKFKDFLKELQDTINAGVNDSGSFPPIVLNKQVKVTPVNPVDRVSVPTPAKDASAKPKPSKKTETALHTFSRLSYMHKNKQNEIKNKNDPDAVNMELNKLNKNILDHKMTKAKYIKHEVTISRVPKPVDSSGDVLGNLQKKNPVLSSMLNLGAVETSKRPSQTSVISNPNQTTSDGMTNREHADLLLLLRNQQTLKVPSVPQRVPSNKVDLPKQNVTNTLTKVDAPVPATYQRLDYSYAAPLTNNKVEPVIVKNPQVTKDSLKTDDDEKQDWESVMNAIRAHKTQPLGPNALEMVLKKDKKQPQSTTKSHINQQRPPSSSSEQNSEPRKRDNNSSRSNSSTHKPSIEKHYGVPKTQNQTEIIKKTPEIEIPKKPEASNKHYTSNPLKQGDPFISGIPNSDYDLLEELMDDDLRQEIGELSSDEESYQAPTVTKVKGGSIPKVNNVCTKVRNPPKSKPHVVDPKTIVCKNAPQLNVPDLNFTRTTVNAGSSTGYTNVIVNPVLPEVTRPENRPTVLCSNIETPHMATNIITNQPENHFIANIAPSNHIEPQNLFITSIPAQPMVLISQELVYDPYSTIRIHESQVSAGLCNVTPNAFVTINPTPNIAVYQTTQFAAPVINPVIIGNAMTTTTNVTNTTQHQQLQPNLDKEEAQPSVKISTNPVLDKPFTDDSNITADRRLNSDINMNKCNERKVLSQMQDNNTYDNAEKDVRIRRLSLDNTSLKSKQDEERIKMKRQALMNREINHSCFHPPIPLSYTPLCKKLNLGKLLQHATPKNGAVKSTLKLRSSSTVVHKDVAAKVASVEIPASKTNNEILESGDQASSTKENHKKFRPIFLRSSSKLGNKTTPRKFTRVPLRRNKFKQNPTQSSEKVDQTIDPLVNNDKTKTDTKTPTRISKRIMNKTIAKVDATDSSVVIDSGINQIQDKKEEASETKLNSDSDLIDFENTLIGSIIFTTASSKPTQEIVPEVNKDNNATDKSPQPLKDNKVAQVCHDKPVILKDTILMSDPTTSSIESAKPIEKLKSNMENEIIVKKSVTSPEHAKKPIVMTIKNQNQAILSNESITKNTDTSQPVHRKIPKNNALPEATKGKLEIALPKSVSTVKNKINVSKPPVVESQDQKLNANHLNHKEKLQNLRHKDSLAKISQNNVHSLTHKISLSSAPPQAQQQALPDNETPLTNKKSSLMPVNTLETVSAKEAPSVAQKDNRHENSTNSYPKPTNQMDVGITIRKPPVPTNAIAQSNKSREKVNSTVENSSLHKENNVCQKTTVQVSNNINSQAISNNESKGAPQLRQEDIEIEEIPIIGNQDPNRKCVRIKLPNGKLFKATVYGQMHVDYNTLFAEPAMKAAMTEGLLDGKRYTLNFKQVSKNTKDDPTKIVGQRFHEINITEKKVPIPTVNLISDDEDEDNTRSFSTEFGKFPTNINLETLNKHQNKFDQRCTVKLFRDDIFKSNRTKPKPKSFPSTPISLLTRNKSKLVSQMQKTTEKVPQVIPIDEEDDLPPVYLNGSEPSVSVPQIQANSQNREDVLPPVCSNVSKTSNNDQNIPMLLLLNQAVTPKEIIPEVIEIDDSSSDGESKISLNCTEPNLEPVEKIIELKNLLLKDLGVNDKNKEKPMSLPLPEKVTAVEDLKSALLEDLGVSITPPKQQESQENIITTESKEETDEPVQTLNKINVKNCVVKIPNCNDLIKKYELIKNAKNCFVMLKRCTFASDVMTDAVESNKTDNCETTESNLDCNDDFIDFDVEETSSPQLSRCPSLSILNNLWDDTCLASAESLYGRSSPVMEIFDDLVSLHNKSKDKLEYEYLEKLKHWICDAEWTMTKHALHDKSKDRVEYEKVQKLKFWICDSEWTMTKHAYSIQEMFETSFIKESKSTLSVCKDNGESPEVFRAPTLVTISFKFLEENPDVVYRLHSIREVEKKALKNNSCNKLKRKTEHVVDNNVSCKILKLGTLVINAINTYSQNADKKSTDNYRNEEISMKADMDLDKQEISDLEISCYKDLPEQSSDVTEQDMFSSSQNDDIKPNIENEYNKQSERTNDQSFGDRDLVSSNNETIEKTTENLHKTEESLPGDIDVCSEVQNNVRAECLNVNIAPNEPEAIGKKASNELEAESSMTNKDIVNLLTNKNKTDCESSKTYENVFDTVKGPSSNKISDAPEEVNNDSCSSVLSQIEPMDKCASFDDQEKSVTDKMVNRPENIYNIDNKVNMNMAGAISTPVNKMQLNTTVTVENNDDSANVDNVLTVYCETDVESSENNTVSCENVNDKSTENHVTANDCTEMEKRGDIEAAAVKSVDIMDQSGILINEPQDDDASAVNDDSETAQYNLGVNLDDSGPKCNENTDAKNSTQKSALLYSGVSVKSTLDCFKSNKDEKLMKPEKLEQNLSSNKSVPPKDSSLDNETEIDCEKLPALPALNNTELTTNEYLKDNNALNATLVEIPISDIPNEAYEVEITDTNLEDNVEIKNSDVIDVPELVISNIDTSLKTDSYDSDITSPVFIDNKEIIFNYHDYTKKPKNDAICTEVLSNPHITKQSINVDNVHHQRSTLNANKADDRISKGISKVEDPLIPSKPECKYELIQEDDWLTVITTEHDNDAIVDPCVKSNDIIEGTEIVTTPDTENAGITIKGIEIEDPVIGTCYVFALNESGSSESNISSESIESYRVNNDEKKSENAILYNNLHDIDFCVRAPKINYSRESLKRKMDMRDYKVTTKKYRKSKNIDCSKRTATSINESAYIKEYKRLLEYCSSVKFSYTRPFHKECVEIDDMTANWPIKSTCTNVPQDGPDVNLFVDVHSTPAFQPDPSMQTLVEEITHDYEKTDALQENPLVEAHETNFDMGFGEGSGRVIQNLKKGGDSNISAATLSDVKQTQPVFMSEGPDNCAVLKSNKDDQMKKIRQYVNFIELRDKVRSFFKKSSVELRLDWMQQNVKESGLKSRYGDGSISVDFPYDLCSFDYLKPPPTEAIVQVVQLGQLPVSAAAQNPVTCDPRVTQVSDASPSQCSVDNSPNDDSQSEIKTEYTELTTADLTLPLVQEYAQQNQSMNLDSLDDNNFELTEQTISLEMEIKAEETPEIKEELPEIKEEGSNSIDNADLHTLTNATPENMDYIYDNHTTKSNSNNVYGSSEHNSSETVSQQRQQNGSTEKTDQIAHAMNAAGITTMSESLNNSRAHALVNILSQKIRQSSVNTTQTTTNTYSKTTSINAMALQQALAQILPPPLNQTGTSENNQTPSTPVGPQVLHIVQGKNASGNQITLVDNSQQSVISTPNATQVLHIVQNKGAPTGQTSNGTLAQQPNSFSGLSLVDAGLQQGGNQLLHIVNTGNQKNANAGQLLKRVNLLTNLANVQGSNEQKMVQFVCKSADGKAIQLNAPHQRSMVLRLQPIETSNVQTPPTKPAESQELSASPTNSAASKDTASQQEIKSRSIYEENYAKFIQNSSSKTPNSEKSTSLPKFNQAFGKAVFQEGNQKPAEGASTNSHIPPVNTHTENSECPSTDNAINLETMRQIGSPPLLIRKSPAVTTQSQSNIVQQIKQTIAPMNIQTMHGGVIYTRQIPVNIGGGQTINLITVPSTELINDESSKPQTANQSEGEPSIIKIVPQNQNTTNAEGSQEENNSHSATNETPPTPQPQPVLTQMRIKLPMLSKAPQMVPGARVVRPSFFQIQRNVIGGANQPVYQQLVLTAAPPLGQQTIRLPQAQASRPIKVSSENQSSSSESQMSSSTLEQLREFDMVLEQVKERSTVQPGTNSNGSSFKLQNNSSDATDGTGSSNCSNESTQVLYSIGNNQSLNVAYVNRKATVTTPTTSTFVRSPDSTGVADSPTSSTHAQIPHTVTSDSSSTDMTSQSKPAKVGSKSKSRPKSSSNPPNTLKLNSIPPKTSSSQKPLEDEQTTQRILYILAEYKEQVENSPDKDKPAPRRRSNPPSNPGSSKRKKSSSSRRSGTRDMSPVHGEDTCRTMGSEDSSCGTSQGDCNESCLDSHSPQDSPRKVARKITFDQEPVTQPRQPQRNVIVADGQTITVARSTTGKPATAVLMPANYILPVSMMKGGQQIAIVTNRGPKLLTVGGEAGAANALLLQRLIGPGGLKPVLARPGVRHVRLPTAALHNLQAFNLAAATVQPPDSTASPTPGPTPPELVDTRATSSPWADRDDVKPERGSSPEGSEPWNLPSSADAHEYTYEETVRTDNMERTVLDPVPGRYSPDMEAQRIFDKMFDVEKKSYVDSPRSAYDIDASDGDDKAYQVVQKKDGTHRQHRLSHVSAAALRHKYAILEHELRLQKSLSEECEDLGVDSPSASELFPEAELLFAASPAHEHTHEPHEHAPPPHQSAVPQPDLDDQMATDQLLLAEDAPLDHEEFARAHPNTTFHREPDEVQPFTITGLKGRHITSTIFHSNTAPATVLMAAPPATVISQAERGKYELGGDAAGLSSAPAKDDARFDGILADTRELHLTTTSAIVHGNAAQVIRRVCYEDDKQRDARFLLDEPDNLIAGDDAKMTAEDSRDATLESMADVDDDRSSPERHAELFWESNSASERSESRKPLDFSSDSDKCCKSPFDETNSTDSSGVGAHMRLDSVIKEARGGSAGSPEAPPLRTYPAARALLAEPPSVSGKTRAGERSPDSAGRRRASGRGAAKRGCPCCAGEPPPARAKKPRQRKPTLDFT